MAIFLDGIYGVLDKIEKDLLDPLLVSENGDLLGDINVDIHLGGDLAADQDNGLVDQFF